MNNIIQGYIAGVISLCLFINLLFCFPANKNHSWYKQGQIDAINGKIEYKLQLNKNGESVWKRINK